jgi:hypothetical protein
MEDRVDGFRLGSSGSVGSLSNQSRPLESLHPRLSSHGSLPKSLDLSRCVSDEKRKKERVIGQEEEKGGRIVWRNRERREKEEKKRIIKNIIKKE